MVDIKSKQQSSSAKDFIQIIEKVQSILIFMSDSREEKEDLKFLNSIIKSKGLELFDEKSISTF